MRMHVFYLAGCLSAAALLATACADRRVRYADDSNWTTTSRSDRDRGYSSGWTSGTYVGSAQEGRTSGYGTSDTGTSGYSSSTVQYSGTQSGYSSGTTQGGYSSGTGTTSGYGTGTGTGYGTSTTGTTQGGYGSGTTVTTYEKSGTLGTTNQPTWWSSVKSAVATVHPIEGQSCKGTVRFTQSDRGLQVAADLEGLKPNQRVRVRINEFGDCSSMTGDSLGKTFSPNSSGMQHEGTEMGVNGSLGVGDLGTLDVDANGRLHLDRTLDSLSIAGGDNAILGRSISIVTEENVGTQPVGTSSVNPLSTTGTVSNGTVLACGVIGIGKSDSFR